jgi:phospholipid-binding lipoprotein MlaA
MISDKRRHRAALRGLGLAVALLAGPACAQTAPEAQPPGDIAVLEAPPYDPAEGFNRHVYAFSAGLDRGVVAPVAHGYMRATPRPVRDRVTVVLANLEEPGTLINDIAQGHPRRAARTTARFAINSTLGLLGLFDVASGLGVPPHDADFGQTLGRYGVQPGPYFYVPIIGPLDVRDGVGRVVDLVIDPVSLVIGGWQTPGGATRTGLTGLDRRVAQDGAFRALDDATDPYATARSAYTQHRIFVVQQATGVAPELPDFEPTPTETKAP